MPIHTGKTQELTIVRRRKEGISLSDEAGTEIMLRPNDRPADESLGGKVTVFVYRDSSGEQVATTKQPKAHIGQFAQLRVRTVEDEGAYLDWGVDTDLFVPYRDQKKPLEEGRWCIVRVALDERSDRIYGSTRLDDFLSNAQLNVKQGDKVDLVVFGKSELGLSVIVNNEHQGLVHANEVFQQRSIGDRIPGYVKQVRPDNKLDITLQPIGYRKYNDANTEMLAKRLQTRTGFLPLNDKSSAEAIYAEFGISKKAFKQALGALYKERKVRIEDEGIVWIG
jgi:predicted RNA-binding protein (virulence factor B family)